MQYPANLRAGLDRLANNLRMLPSGCLIYMTSKSERERGAFRFGVFSFLPYRFVYLATVGPLPARQEVDHLCGNRACVQPTHLEAVSGPENRKRDRLRGQGKLDRAAEIERRTRELLAEEEVAARVELFASYVHPGASVWIVAARAFQEFDPPSRIE